MMIWLRVAVVLLGLVLAALFFYGNLGLLSQHVPVTLRLPLLEIRPMPPEGPRIDTMLLVAFGFGFAMAYVLGLFRRMQSALKIRQLKKQINASNTSSGSGWAKPPKKPESTPAFDPADDPTKTAT